MEVLCRNREDIVEDSETLIFEKLLFLIILLSKILLTSNIKVCMKKKS